MFAPAGQTTARAGLRSKLAALVVRRQAPPNPRRGKRPPCQRGAGRVSGLGDSDGPCVAARYPRRRPGIPPPRLRSAPPFDKGGFSRGLCPRKKAPLLGELAELARPEGSRRALRYHPSTVTRRQPSEPFRPSLPLGHLPCEGRLLSRASPAQKAPHAVGSWPSLRGLRGFDGLYVTAPSKLRKSPLSVFHKILHPRPHHTPPDSTKMNKM